jgi:hypothetical protein
MTTAKPGRIVQVVENRREKLQRKVEVSDSVCVRDLVARSYQLGRRKYTSSFRKTLLQHRLHLSQF